MNAFGQVNMKKRKALKDLNSKLDTLDGALKEQDDDDMVRILNSRLTQEEYDKASAADRLTDDNNSDYDFTLKKHETARRGPLVRVQR